MNAKKKLPIAIFIALHAILSGLVFADPEIMLEGTQTGSTFVNIDDGDDTPSTRDGTLFAPVNVGGSFTHVFRIRNTGDTQLGIFSIIDNSGQFSVNPVTATVAAGGSETFVVTFSPNAIGTHDATLTLDTNDADEDPFTFDVRGTGEAPDIFVRGGPTQAVLINDGDNIPETADGTDFGDVPTAGANSVTHTFSIHNSAAANKNLIVSGITLGGTGDSSYTIVDAPTIQDPIPPGGKHDFDIVFDPLASGILRAGVTIINTDPDENLYTFDVIGTGIVTPEIVVEGRKDAASVWENIGNRSPTPVTANGTEFPDTSVGQAKQHLFRVRNIGLANLFLTAADDDNSPDFEFEGIAGVIKPGEEDEFTITFRPQSGGAKATTFSISNNDLNENPFLFVIGGRGLAGELEVLDKPSQTVIANGDNTPSAPDGTLRPTLEALSGGGLRSYEIRNAGNDLLKLTPGTLSGDTRHFSIASFPAPGAIVPPGAKVEFSVLFSPQWAGTHRVTVELPSDDPLVPIYRFDIEGDATGEAEITVRRGYLPDSSLVPEGSNLDVGNQQVNFLLGRAVACYVHNDGNALLEIAASSSTSAFRIYDPSSPVPPDEIFVIEPGESKRFRIYFVPRIHGPDSATITIANNDPNENPRTFTVTGVGISPDINVLGEGPDLDVVIEDGDTSPDLVKRTMFHPWSVSASGFPLHTFVIENLGNDVLTLSPGSISRGPFEFRGLLSRPVPIAPGASHEFAIAFRPTVVGRHTATVTLLSDDPNKSSFTFRVAGEGVEYYDGPDIKVNGNSPSFDTLIQSGSSDPVVEDGTDFGTVIQGSAPETRTFQIRNDGDENLEVLQIKSADPDVSFNRVPQVVFWVGGTATFDITFSPNTVGVHNAIISITSNDPDVLAYLFLVRLTVEPNPDDRPPEITDFDLGGQIGSVDFPTQTGKTYRLTTSTDLKDPWVTVPGTGPIEGTGGLRSFTFTLAVAGERRFYRLEVEATP